MEKNGGDIFNFEGFSLPSWGKTNYGSPRSDDALRAIGAIGGNTVEIVPTYYISTRTAHDFGQANENKTEPLANIASAIAEAHDLGLNVVLKPHVDSADGVFREEFLPDNPQAWFTAYIDNVIIPLAELAEENDVEIFTIGTEFRTIMEHYGEYWNDVVSAVRHVYHGKITYAANWNEYSKLDQAFWKSLDFIGIDAYNPVASNTQPSVTAIEQNWLKILDDFQQFSIDVCRPVLLTEIGYPSVDGAGMQPWNPDKPVPDPGEQADLFAGFFRALYHFENRADWLSGALIWNWVIDPVHDTKHAYWPKGKPAERIIHDALTGSNPPVVSPREGTPLADRMFGSFASDRISGLGGNDVILGLGNADLMNGNDGNDTLEGGSGSDTLSGGNGNDTLSVGFSNDRLAGNDGNDTLDGGTGTDTVAYTYAIGGITVSLARSGSQSTGGSRSDTLLSIENLIGSRYDDNLAGSSAANRLDGGAGNDTLNAGIGADSMTGGNGSDLYYVDHARDRVFETNTSLATGGNDTVYSSLPAYTLSANVENLRLLSNGTAAAIGNTLNNTLYAGAGNNVLNGGGSGTDTASYAYATAGVSVSLAKSGSQSTGGSGSDTLLGIDNLTGSAHNDELSGNSAANKLSGGAGADTLKSGSGNDLLLGGLGNDRLTGGTGKDNFRFDTRPNANSNRDQITDFSVRDDTLQLDNAAFTALTKLGTLAAASLRAGAGLTRAADANDYLIYNKTTGALYYDADGSGTGSSAVQFASLSHGLVLSNLDFVVI